MKQLVVLAVAILSGCSTADSGFEISGQVAGGQVAYVEPLLLQARRNFFGGGGGGPGWGGGLNEPVELQGTEPTYVALTWSRDVELGGDWQVRSAVRLSHQEARAWLPQGLGVLTDPMHVGLSAEAFAVEVALERSLEVGTGRTLDFAAGLGVQQVAARGRLQSALIDVSSQVDLTQPYVVLSGRYGVFHGTGLAGQVLLYQGGGAEYQLGFVKAF